MPTLRGFSAWIMSEGKELQEFKPEIQGDDDSSISCWIPSEEGKKFEVHWRDIHGGIPTSGDVNIDGSLVGGRLSLHGLKRTTLCVKGLEISDHERQPFLFSKLQTTDDESANVHVGPDFGAISLSIWRVVIGQRKAHKPKPRQTDVQSPVHERSKKAGCHVVAFAAPEPASVRTWSTKPYSPDDAKRPFVKFVFRYRPLDLLRANEIAPPLKPKPTQTSSNRHAVIKIEDSDEEDLVDDEEIQALKEKLKKMEARKRKSDDKGGQSSKRVKVEQIDFSKHFTPGEIIDLT
ncbi:hypothetical protein BOTBODRAFT_174393 [Botryobasidium botryosum FD-172 SS1]|uniref:DUF7918 domain-containing protein n=1 Tax=Botryobasidium botryosum (strain FD-172 SS1) TaxID=930990 RepID=A0A067MSS3_BOTB1|nr:hypothetical protein BOTBODRAFT_174393 [Botryobasidium botryosum FD-172 SS1]